MRHDVAGENRPHRAAVALLSLREPVSSPRRQWRKAPMRTPARIAVPLLVIGGFALLLWSNRASSETALSFGKVFTTDEIMAVEQALQEAPRVRLRAALPGPI